MNKVFRLVVLLLQPLCQMPYSIALLSARFAAANQPSVDWMKDVHKSIDSAARKNLRAVYLFEPTFVVKSMSFALQSCVSTQFFKKILLVSACLFFTLMFFFCWDFFPVKSAALPLLFSYLVIFLIRLLILMIFINTSIPTTANCPRLS